MTAGELSDVDRESVKRRIYLVIISAILISIVSVGLYFLVYRRDLYTGFYYYFFDSISSQASILLLALFAGVVSFFSPCAFALLPSYMSYYLSLEDKKETGSSSNKVKRSLHLGSLCALGLLLFYMSVGILVAVFGNSIVSFIPALSPVVGIILMILGIVLFTDYSFRMGHLQRFLGTISARLSRKGESDGKSSRNIFLYGVGFGAATSACMAPIFVALIVASLAFGGLALSIMAFLVYSLAMGFMIIITTILVAFSKDVLMNKLKASTSVIKKVSGIVLIAIGIYLVYFYLVWIL